jgi:hypothetical protein
MTFATEARLVEAFVAKLVGGETPWQPQGHRREFDYISGRTDVVAVLCSNEVLAFEAKLRDWRRALRQAWRNTSFANRAYVVLPRKHCTQALRHRMEFEARGVGLCAVDADSVELLIECRSSAPVLPWLQDRARCSVAGSA